MRGMQGNLGRDVVLRKVFEKENGYTENIHMLHVGTVSMDIHIHAKN